jgi:drug/metabolite transporter (DMT)-like permease
MGELAGLFTAICWSIGATFFTEVSKRIGSLTLNRVRLLFAVILLMVVNWISQGSFLPLDAGLDRWLWLGGSGIIALFIGDGLMFQAYVTIGTRLAMLVNVLSPIFSAVIAWLILGETLSPGKIVGIMVTLVGVAIVILERGNVGDAPKDRRKYVQGLLMALGAVITYAIGYTMSKEGLKGDYPAISGVVMRLSIAMVFAWIPAIFLKDIGNSFKKTFNNSRMLLFTSIGTILGPFLGIWLSLVAVQKTEVGIASTLISTAPIFLLPISKWVLKEKVSVRAVLGTLVAIVGVALIFIIA